MTESEQIAILRTLLRDCADDLEAELKHRYAKTLHYPSQKRDYDADMTSVIRARAMLATIK